MESEFIGIVNYGLIALIQLELGPEKESFISMNNEEALAVYDLKAQEAKALMLA